MPTVSANPISDYIGAARTGASSTAAGFTDTSDHFGSMVDVVSNALTGYCWMGHFELEVPDDSTITGVRLEVTATASLAGVASIPVRAGFIGRDGTWDVSGFSTANYATDDDMLFPVTVTGTVTSPSFTFTPSEWHGGGAGFAGSYSIVTSGFPEDVLIGNGATVDVATDGLQTQLQSFLDDTSAADRTNTGSGTALGMLIAIFPDQPVTLTGLQTISTLDHATADQRPVLFVDYTENTPARGACARCTTARAIHARLRSARSISARLLSSVIAYARGRTR